MESSHLKVPIQLNEIMDNLSFPCEILFLVKSYKDVSTIADKLFAKSDEASSMKT